MNSFRENVLRIIAVLGLLAVLLLGAWGIIQIAFVLPSFFGNLGGAIGGLFTRAPQAQTESLTMSVPASVVAEQPFTLNWAHTGSAGEYSYQVSYSCESGLSIAAPVPTGTYTQVACDTPFNYINASSSMPLVAVLASGTTSAHPTFTLNATELASGKVTATAHAGTTVTPAAAKPATTPAKTTSDSKPSQSNAASTGSPQATYYASGRTSNLWGYPDLAVRINSASSQNGNVTVVFTVSNIGTNISPANWTLNAILPIQGQYTYPAGPQQALYPGDKIVYTLRYSGASNYNNAAPVYGGPGTCNSYGPCNVPGYAAIPYTQPVQPTYGYNPYDTAYTYSYTGMGYNSVQNVSIQVDPYNLVAESVKTNNYATASYYAY